MLLFWIFAGLITAGAVILIVRPLAAAAGYGAAATEPGAPGLAAPAPEAAADVAVYRDQLAEIDVDLQRGLISPEEAEAARVEIARRLLAKADSLPGSNGADAASVSPSASVKARSDTPFYLLAGVVPLVALGLYLAQGSPGLPGMPVAERLARAPSPTADADELVARVEARLRADPKDGQGWEVIAPVYLKMERFSDAADAYRRSIVLLGESVRRLSGLAEAIILAQDGIVTEEARLAYKRMLELDADRVEARFGLALAQEQDGDLTGAVKAYEAMLQSAPPMAPWRPYITERLEALAARLNGDKPGAAPVPSPAPATGVPAGGEAIAALPPEERRKIILQMVDSLSQRLKANGRDAEGWQRLMRSWVVLGDPQKAEAALAEARKALADDQKGLSEINAFAKELGLKS